jgi:hypothetical protein
MEAMGEEDALAKHTLISCGKLDLRDCKSMTKVERTIHVRIWEVAKPFRIFLCDFCGRKTC